MRRVVGRQDPEHRLVAKQRAVLRQRGQLQRYSTPGASAGAVAGQRVPCPAPRRATPAVVAGHDQAIACGTVERAPRRTRGARSISSVRRGAMMSGRSSSAPRIGASATRPSLARAAHRTLRHRLEHVGRGHTALGPLWLLRRHLAGHGDRALLRQLDHVSVVEEQRAGATVRHLQAITLEERAAEARALACLFQR